MVVPSRIMIRLLAGEKSIICTRRHPVILLRPVVTFLAAVAVAIAVHTLRESLTIEVIVWVLSGSFACSAVVLGMDWYLGYFVVTTQRLMLPSSAFSDISETIKVDAISDTELYRSMHGKLFGYGDLIIISGGKGKLTISCLPYPVQLYQEVSQLLRSADSP